MLVTNIGTKTAVLGSRPCSSPQLCNTQMQDMHTQEPTWHPPPQKKHKKPLIPKLNYE